MDGCPFRLLLYLETGTVDFLEQSELLGIMRVIYLMLVALVACGLICTAEAADRKRSSANIPVTIDLRPRFVLLSWTGMDGSYRFALVRDKNGLGLNRFLERFDRGNRTSTTLDGLERDFVKLPRPSLIEWYEDKSRHMSYPSKTVIRNIKDLAACLHLDLQFNDWLY